MSFGNEATGRVLARVLARRALPWLEVSDVEHRGNTGVGQHAHARARVMYVVGGAVREETRGGAHTAGPGALLVRPAGRLHANRFGPRGLRTINVILNTDALPFRLGRSLLTYRWLDGEPVAHAFQRIVGEAQTWTNESATLVEGLVLELLEALAEQDRPRQDAPRWLDVVRSALRDRLDHHHRLDELGALAGVHPAHLARAFRARFGCTVGEYLRAARVERAQGLLDGGELALAEIASACGFTDQAHFTRVFRGRVGLTPGRYRRLVRGR